MSARAMYGVIAAALWVEFAAPLLLWAAGLLPWGLALIVSAAGYVGAIEWTAPAHEQRVR